MNKEQLKQLRSAEGAPAAIGLGNLTDPSPRTLLYGQTKSRAKHHVYIAKDGLIHILVHVPLLAAGDSGSYGDDFLVLQHTVVGRWGGLRYPDTYVPDGCVFAEYSDFEFCKLLEDGGFHLPFAPIKNVVGPHQPYQGAIMGQGLGQNGIDLHMEVRGLRCFPALAPEEARLLANRLVAQAALETNVVYADMGINWSTYVAESGVDKVLRKVDEYLVEMQAKGLADFTTESLVFSVFGRHAKFQIGGKSDCQGVLMFSVSAKGRVSLAEFTSYTAEHLGYPGKKFLGSYRDRPLVLDTQGEDERDGSYRVYFSRFGDPVQFQADMLESFELEQRA